MHASPAQGSEQATPSSTRCPLSGRQAQGHEAAWLEQGQAPQAAPRGPETSRGRK